MKTVTEQFLNELNFGRVLGSMGKALGKIRFKNPKKVINTVISPVEKKAGKLYSKSMSSGRKIEDEVKKAEDLPKELEEKRREHMMVRHDDKVGQLKWKGTY